MPLTIVRNDITKMNVDAIVNAANTSLQEGGGVCGAIFYASGAERLQAACDNLAPIQTGEAVVTKGFALPAKYIIHAAGPVYRNGKQGEEALLRSCYTTALDLAVKHGCNSIAFPLISSGIYGYPKKEALAVATSSIGQWLIENDDLDVSLVVFDKAAFSLSQKLLGKVRSFVSRHFVDERETLQQRRQRNMEESEFLRSEVFSRKMESEARYSHLSPTAYEAFSDRLDEPFAATLLRLIDAKGRTDVEVYKRANIDRKLFSKIRTGKGYMPSKKTVVALAIALELSVRETRDLLERAGFALSRSMMFDVIVEYFITHKQYDIFEINNVLFEYDQPLLGG